MYEYDFFATQEEINDNYKTVNKAITVTITLAEYRSLISEKQRLECENFRLNNELADLQQKYADVERKWLDNGVFQQR